MRNIKKLTPELIKQIIAEEKLKLQQEVKKLQLKERNDLLQKLRLLKKIKNHQAKSIQENKKIEKIKFALVKNIKKRKL